MNLAVSERFVVFTAPRWSVQPYERPDQLSAKRQTSKASALLVPKTSARSLGACGR